jgi:CheY-like chemotaxis protein
MEPLNVMPFLVALMETVEPLAARHCVSLTLDPLSHADSAWILTDRERFRQVLLNLLSNAVKYNHRSGSVRVSILPSPPDRWAIHVSDTGVGIPHEMQQRLFMPFERIDSADHPVEAGSGLGLALTQKIVQALGGKISVVSVVGKGSRFWVEMPRVDSPDEIPGGGEDGLLTLFKPESEMAILGEGEQKQPVESKWHEPSRSKVLYVEDDVANVYLLERIMEVRGGVKLLSAQLGRLGLELASEHQPKLILLDLNLPDLRGEDFLERLRVSPTTSKIPVVAVSGEVGGDRMHRLMELGAVATLTKPYDLSDLLALIDQYVK